MIKSFHITKTYFDCTDYSYHIVTEYNPAGEILSLYWNTPSDKCNDLYKNAPVNVPCDTEEESDLYGQSFDGLWYDFPIPFEEGDIVCDALRKTPFVLTGIVPWYKQEQSKRDGKPREGCDYSDMIAYGYCYDENDKKHRDEYIENHKKWFLKNHPDAVSDFMEEVQKKYGNKENVQITIFDV